MPKLRFPGFDGDLWKSQPLQMVADFVDDRASVHDISRNDYVSTENLLPDFGGISPPSSFPATGSVVRYQTNDVLAANIRPYLKKIWLADKSGGASNDVIVIRARSDTGYIYLAHVLKSDRFISYAMSGAKGLKMPRGDVALIREYPVPLPCAKAEQQKIAECLSKLDELIGAESQKLDALKAHKKGLMQQLFPREGETLPRLRFPEFQDAPEWEEKKLEALAKRGSGHTPSKAHPEYYNGGIKWVSLADSRRLDKGLISETENEISEEGVENSSAVLHPAGAVLVSRDAGVGKSAVMGSAMAVSQHFIVWKCDSKKLSNWFLYYVLQTLKPLFERAATGSTIKTIGLQFFVDLVLIVPSLTEQRRIASCLSSLDDLIAAQSDQLEALKTHKKGLMQQLFPSPAEVEA